MFDTSLRKRKSRVAGKTVSSAADVAYSPLEERVDAMAEVLIRDQRTCSLLSTNFDDMSAEEVTEGQCHCRPRTEHITGKSCGLRYTDTVTRVTSRKQENRNRRHTSNKRTSLFPRFLKRSLHRLGELVVIGACLLSVIRPAMSAPTPSPPQQRPKWINPCGFGSSDEFDSELVDLGLRLNDQEILTQIVVQAKNALMHADLFKEDYVKNTFNVDFQQHHNLWQNNHYTWLPSQEDIPKSLGQPTPVGHLNKLELDQALKDSYTYMQKLAVGLEQVVWDQQKEHGEYHKEFQDTEYKLRATLCEIQVAIMERNLMQHEDVSRDLMGAEYRQLGNASYRNLRDWLIFRDYMNGLEYIIEVFEYFKHKLTS